MPAALFGVDWEGWFSIAGTLAMAGWAILILAPRRWPLLNAIPAYGLPVALSGGYGVLALLYFADATGGYGSLAEVARLFESPPVLLAGWVHYLAFDLFVGAWIARRADAMSLSRWIQAPILVATFMLGPVGLLLFLATAGAARRLAPKG